MILLNRDTFRNAVFTRDDYKCVICGEPAKDAHHILERRLFTNGGYYLNNGSSLCAKHHIQAEETTLSIEEIRDACKIVKKILPLHLYEDTTYDKWGNEILPNGLRIKGELYNDESVQKILKQGNVLNTFTNRVKYPRTYHVPGSPGMTRDDRMMEDVTIYEGKEVVLTEKMDGENCLDADTIITTEDGLKSIQWICENKYTRKILTYNIKTNKPEFQNVTNWQILENNNDWYEIELETGQTVKITGNDRVWLPKLKQYKRVDELNGDEDVLLKK